MTLLPNLTPSVKHVTMVQRTPSYIAALPGQERFQGRIVHPQLWDEKCDETIR